MATELQSFMDELRARISIADVVGAKVKLTKKGREHQGLCPFHNEKTPSFTVNEAKGFYHCFGCGAHGDIIKFEMEANGLPFMEALQKLAHQAGLTMPQFSKKDKEESEKKKSLYEIMETACTFFQKELMMPEGAEGLRYFKDKRGLKKETIQKFRLGYAPQNNALLALLKAQGLSESEMKELGLIAIPEDASRRPHDFFRNRVMIPITNKQGQIIAFGGRVMEKIEPKYLNSPDTPIFNKRRNLYNLANAREIAYKEKQLIICEGYMDVIALDSYGFGYAVAPLGTALTEEQIAEAWRVCPEPILCLDGDAPGIKAAMRAVDRALPMLKPGYSLKFLFLPDNQDPDEYLRARGHDSFAALMQNTRPLIDVLWQKYTEGQDTSTPEKKALIEKTLLDEVAKIGDYTVRSYYAQDIKNRIYQNFKKSAWQKESPAPAYSPRRPQIKPAETAVPPAYLDDIPPAITEAYSLDSAASSSRAPKSVAERPQPPKAKPPFPSPAAPRRTSGYKKSTARPYLNHNITAATSPENLRQAAFKDEDKNIRFIIAAFLIYPELIDDYEEAVFADEIKDPNLKSLLNDINDIYHNATEVLSAPALRQKILNTNSAPMLNSLWELAMLQEENPFINDLRINIDKLLLEDKLRSLEAEIKKLTSALCLNFDEETYLRRVALQKEKENIINSAQDNE